MADEEGLWQEAIRCYLPGNGGDRLGALVTTHVGRRFLLEAAQPYPPLLDPSRSISPTRRGLKRKCYRRRGRLRHRPGYAAAPSIEVARFIRSRRPADHDLG